MVGTQDIKPIVSRCDGGDALPTDTLADEKRHLEKVKRHPRVDFIISFAPISWAICCTRKNNR
jgi:hypothetical protein